MVSKLVVHTDRISAEKQREVEQLVNKLVPADVEVDYYNHNIEVSWRDINKYAECKNVDELLAINPDYKNDLTSEGEWIYPLNSLLNGQGILANNSSIKKVNFYAPSLSWTYLKDVFFNCSNLVEAYVYAPNAGSGAFAFSSCQKLKKVSGNLNSLTSGDSLFQNSPVETIEIEFPKLSRGVRFATSTNNSELSKPRLNKTSVLRIINSIPTYTDGSHPLDIGIHVDHQNDEEVLAAIANAESKGWTLTVQWNGTATAASTASTFGLRGQPIYAKVSEIERPDGTTERVLDWGHYVTDPSGYEEFSSLESAYKYFNLEMPENE